MQTRERALCARSVFPFIKEKEENAFASDGLYSLRVSCVVSLVLVSHVDQLAWKQYG